MLCNNVIGSNYSDIRGWKIVDADNRTIGKIDNLWVNKDMQRVVCIVISGRDIGSIYQ